VVLRTALSNPQVLLGQANQSFRPIGANSRQLLAIFSVAEALRRRHRDVAMEITRLVITPQMELKALCKVFPDLLKIFRAVRVGCQATDVEASTYQDIVMWPGSSPTSLVNGAAGMTIIALVIVALHLADDFLIPLALAGFLSFILQPLVQWLDDRRWPRPLAVLSVVVMTTCLLGLAGVFLAREVSSLAAELPRYETNLREKARTAAITLQSVGVWHNASKVLERVEDELKTPSTEAAPLKVEVRQEESRPLAALLAYIQLTLSPLATIGLTFLFTIFMLLQYHDLRDRIVHLMGPSEIGRSTQALNEAALDLAHFFRLQAGLNLSFGIVVGIVLWLIGLPNPALWGALAAVSRFIPYIGGVVAAVGPLLIAASVEPGWAKLVATGSVIAAAEFTVGYIIEPLLFGTKTRLSPLAVLISAAFWTTLWGPVGLILALPLTLGLVVFGEHIPQLAFLRVVLGNNPALTADQRLYHLLLAGDASEAGEEAGKFLNERSLEDYLEEVVIPALSIAAKDSSNGVLRREQLTDLKETTEEFVELCKDMVEMRHDQKVEVRPKAVAAKGSLVAIPGRGSFDQAAGELFVLAARMAGDETATCTSPGGLTGISAAAARRESPIKYLAIVTVGGVTGTQLQLLKRRAQRDLCPDRLGILVAEPVRLTAHDADGADSSQVFGSLKSLLRDSAKTLQPVLKAS
jgi:predicted PurR-regulated permease PerM